MPDWILVWSCSRIGHYLVCRAIAMLFLVSWYVLCMEDTCSTDVSGPFQHAGCRKSAGGNTFLIKFLEADIFCYSAYWMISHVLFAESEYFSDVQDSYFLSSMKFFWPVGWGNHLNCMNNRQFLLGRKICYLLAI